MSKTPLVIVLVGGAAYFLFKDQLSAMFGTTPAANPAASAASATSNPAPSNILPTSAATTRAMILQRAMADPSWASTGGLLNGWQWNWWYKIVRGQDVPSLAFADWARKMTIDEFMNALASVGLSGMRRAF